MLEEAHFPGHGKISHCEIVSGERLSRTYSGGWFMYLIKNSAAKKSFCYAFFRAMLPFFCTKYILTFGVQYLTMSRYLPFLHLIRYGIEKLSKVVRFHLVLAATTRNQQVMGNIVISLLVLPCAHFQYPRRTNFPHMRAPYIFSQPK